MPAIVLVLIVGALAVLVLDTIGSIASRQFGFRYGSLAIVSWILWLGTGFFAAWYGRLSLSLLAGGIVAFIDATLGWYISWLTGPGRPKSKVSGTVIGRTVLIVTAKGAALGFIGGLLA
jgi:hypothetical protein